MILYIVSLHYNTIFLYIFANKNSCIYDDHEKKTIIKYIYIYIQVYIKFYKKHANIIIIIITGRYKKKNYYLRRTRSGVIDGESAFQFIYMTVVIVPQTYILSFISSQLISCHVFYIYLKNNFFFFFFLFFSFNKIIIFLKIK